MRLVDANVLLYAVNDVEPAPRACARLARPGARVRREPSGSRGRRCWRSSALPRTRPCSPTRSRLTMRCAWSGSGWWHQRRSRWGRATATWRSSQDLLASSGTGSLGHRRPPCRDRHRARGDAGHLRPGFRAVRRARLGAARRTTVRQARQALTPPAGPATPAPGIRRS